MAPSALLPVFLLAGLGALLARLPWLRPGWHAGVTELAARFLVPALLFASSYRTGIPPSLSWQVLCAFYLPLALLFLGARRLGKGGDGAAAALASTYSNTVFVGVPVLMQVGGSASLQFAYPVIAFHSLFCFSLYHLSEDGGQGGGVRRAVRSTLGNPIVAALLAGLVLNLAGIDLPPAFMRTLDMLSSAALPCALLSVGGSVVLLRGGRWTSACAIVAAKLVLLPLGVALLGLFVLHLPVQAAMVLIVLASCPVGINAAFVVRPGGPGAQLVNSAILLSSLACAASIPAWLWMLRHLPPA